MDPLRVIPLGGLGEIGMNMLLLEHGESIIAIDCGLLFPGSDLLGVDLVLPDVSYLLNNNKKFHGIVLTHAHEDHIGALPFILKQIPVPVFGTRLTMGFLHNKLREHGIESSTDMREITAGKQWKLGPFQLEGIRVTHSLIQCLALAIETPVGTIVHTGDFKIDQTPMDGELFDFHKFAAYGEKGILLLLSDSTNVEREGHTPSEREVAKNLEDIYGRSQGRIFLSTFSSNIPRIQQVANLSERFGRTLVLSGRSMLNNAQIASDLGYLKLPSGVLTESDKWKDLPLNRVAFLTTGSQGEPLSVLHRLALNNHRLIKIEPGDTVVLSARFIPGNEKTIYNLINHLFRCGAEVHYEKVSEIHVSGHASQEELKTMLQLVQPQFFVPIHGEFRHLVKHIQLAQKVGIKPENCFLLEDGDVLELTSNSARKVNSIPAGRIFVDGKGVGDVEDIVIQDRRHLSENGMVLAVIAIHHKTGDLVAGPDLISRGFIRSENGEEVLERAKNIVLETIRIFNQESRADPTELQEEIRKALRRYFYKTVQRRPVVFPFIMEM